EDGIALAVLLEGRDPAEVPAILPQYETMRRVRTDVIQAEARKNGLRFDSKYEDLEQRDREVANSAAFRRWLFDYDVQSAAISQRAHSKDLPAHR
ncbi:2-polyprenyl-6-methoxyphenol hydroxylase, partial [Bradyrhizobium sp. MOS002]